MLGIRINPGHLQTDSGSLDAYRWLSWRLLDWPYFVLYTVLKPIPSEMAKDEDGWLCRCMLGSVSRVLWRDCGGLEMY